MKKLIAVSLFISLMVLPCNTMAAVTVNEHPFINEAYGFEDNYHICYLDYQCFLVPNYFSEKEILDNTYSLFDENRYIHLAYLARDVILGELKEAPEYIMREANRGSILDTARNFYHCEPATYEEVNTRTNECSIATAYSDDKTYTLKIACMFDPYTVKEYMIAFLYRTEDDQKYSEDFYKILYSDPFYRDIESVE